MEGLLRARPPNTVHFSKIKGHATSEDVQRNIISHSDRIGNHMADILARKGLQQAEIDETMVNRIKNKTKLTGQVQRMMVEILVERMASDASTEQQND
eukprot:6865967-Karenia_brevis.AAC.1